MATEQAKNPARRTPNGRLSRGVDTPELNIARDKVCFLILKAREFDAKDEESDSDPGSNATDDGMIEVLEDHSDDPVVEELTQMIDAMSIDEQIDLVALVWLGRESAGADEWAAMRADAASAYNGKTARYLLGIPLLGDYLEEGLAALGISCN